MFSGFAMCFGCETSFILFGAMKGFGNNGIVWGLFSRVLAGVFLESLRVFDHGSLFVGFCVVAGRIETGF